jgi:amino acid/peptide:H+ symporter
MNDPTAATAVTPPPGRQFLGHPLGLVTLFSTEFFERFTYYGMRALLVLFLVAATTGANPGFGIDAGTAGAVYGLYTGAVYLGCVPGGWIADRLIGQRNAVMWGGVIIAIGNFILAIPATPAVFYLGLAVIVIGVGLLKPNISAMPASRSSTWASISVRSCRRWWPAPSARPGTGAAASSAAACSCC